VDRESERLIAETLLRECPDSAIMGEELTPDGIGDQNGLLWIVDPLDGTTNFLHGYPAYAVSIAAMVDGKPTVGVVVDVPRNIVYHATAGGGSWCGERQLEVSETSDPALALIGTGFPFKALDQLPQYLRNLANILSSTSGIRRAGSAALDLADVSLGHFDGFWELSLAPWDVAAGTLLVREAGGVVTDTDGGSDVVRQGPIVAGNPEIQRWLLEVLTR
jgi:myo-inositol-1(or 4)-monophosphatase